MTEFYMTLLSNSSMNFFPENKTSSFTVQLPRSVKLFGDWEVALTEIHYPYSFFTVQDGDNEIKIKTFKATKEFIDSKGKSLPPMTWSTLKITPGFYSNVKEIINAINKEIQKAIKLADYFQFDEKTSRVSLKSGIKPVDGGVVINAFKMRGRLALQLGYKPDDEVSVSKADPLHSTNITTGIPDVMMVYCDVVESQIIGDSWAKVMRTLITSPESGESYFSRPCSREFSQLHYIPLQKKHFDAISIDIRDVTGKLFPFRFGTLNVKLHFKKRN